MQKQLKQLKIYFFCFNLEILWREQNYAIFYFTLKKITPKLCWNLLLLKVKNFTCELLENNIIAVRPKDLESKLQTGDFKYLEKINFLNQSW